MNLKIVTLLMSFAVATVSAQNPIIRNQFSGDPTARVFNGKVYLFPSHDIPPTSANNYSRKDWFCMEDYHVFSSENLTDWTDHGVIVNQKQVPWGNHTAYSMWAPDCVEHNGKYYFYFSDVVKDGFDFGIGICVADKPEGPYTTLPNNIKGINGIDPSILQASDGNNYIFWGSGSCAKLKSNMVEIADDTPTETIKFGDKELQMSGVNCLKGLPSRQAEGLFSFEYNGNYYLTYSYVRNNTEVIGYAMAKNAMGPYEYKGIIFEEWSDCSTNHNSIINYHGQWYLFYHHNNYSPNFDKSRSVCVDSLFFNSDGTIQQVKPTLRGVGITKATDKIQIDRYSQIGGTAKIDFLHNTDADTTKRFEGWKTIFGNNGNVRYNCVDFGLAKLKTVVVQYQSAQDGSITITDGKGKTIAKALLPKNSKFADKSISLKYQPKNINDIIIVASNIEIDYIYFR